MSATTTIFDKKGRVVRLGDRVAFETSRWIFWTRRLEGLVTGFSARYGLLFIQTADMRPGEFLWGRGGNEVEIL